MTSERNELVEVIDGSAIRLITGEDKLDAYHVADAILAAGYRRKSLQTKAMRRMDGTMIPAQAVEAAAKVMYEEVFAPDTWEEEGEVYKTQFSDSMRRALEAAGKAATEDSVPTEIPRRACAEPVWDGPYKMTCGHLIVRGKCVRHGENGATYEIRTGPDAR